MKIYMRYDIYICICNTVSYTHTTHIAVSSIQCSDITRPHGHVKPHYHGRAGYGAHYYSAEQTITHTDTHRHKHTHTHDKINKYIEAHGVGFFHTRAAQASQIIVSNPLPATVPFFNICRKRFIFQAWINQFLPAGIKNMINHYFSTRSEIMDTAHYWLFSLFPLLSPTHCPLCQFLSSTNKVWKLHWTYFPVVVSCRPEMFLPPSKK